VIEWEIETWDEALIISGYYNLFYPYEILDRVSDNGRQGMCQLAQQAGRDTTGTINNSECS
jgi:hypothetical protein